jgi:hypothetical protein
MPEEPYRWSERFGGVPGLTPAEYYHLGRVDAALTTAQRRLDLSNRHGVDLDGLNPTPAEESALEQTLDEILQEEGALESWAEGGGNAAIGSLLDAMTADPADMEGRPRMDDLSNAYGETDLTGYSFAAQSVDDRHGPGFSQRLAERGVPRMIDALARDISREAHKEALKEYRKSKGGQRRAEGNVHDLMEAHAETGITGTGHKMDLANQPGEDASRAIELARYTGDLAGPCSAADAYGRCSARYHETSCSHVAEGAAARAGSPQDAQGYLGVLQRYARTPLPDAEGRGWRTTDGLPATASDTSRR